MAEEVLGSWFSVLGSCSGSGFGGRFGVRETIGADAIMQTLEEAEK
jgi:hypothetical protein